MMKKLFAIVFVLTALNSFSQELTCKDFKEGSFVGTSNQIPGVEWTTVRLESEQSEVATKIPKQYLNAGFPTKKVYTKIEWLDDCKFKAIYDDSKMDLDEYELSVNKNGGIITTFKNIEGKCASFISVSKNNEKEITIKGEICKVD